MTTIGIRRQHREKVGCQNDVHNCKGQEEQLREEIRRLQNELARLQRDHEEERRKQLEEEARRKKMQYIKYLESGNSLIDKANSLASHRQNCATQLLPAAKELKKLITEYVVAIVGTTSSTVLGAGATGVLAVCAPITFGITGIIAAGTAAATIAVAAGGGVGAEKVRERIKKAREPDRAKEWIVKDRELCTAMLGGVIAYKENWNEMKRMFNDETSMHAYLERQGLEQLSEVQKRFTQLSAKVVQKWRDQKYDPQNTAAMRGGKAQARSAVHQFIHDPNRQHDFSTITQFFDYTEITDMLLEYAEEKKKVPHVKQLIERIVSDLKADAEHIQHFAELKSMHYSKP